MKKNLNIALLYGGTSSERDISLISGDNVGKALLSKGHNVEFIDTKDKSQLKILFEKDFDIAFNALHGKGGEDGSIQGLLETIKLPYTGSKIHASARAINKADTKAAYDRSGITNAPYFVVHKNEQVAMDSYLKTTGDDVVVKAASEGSSIGLYFAKGKQQILEAIDKAFKFDDIVIVETRIPGREFTCAVIEFPQDCISKHKDKLTFDGNAAAMPVIEIIPKNEYYDFQSKYDEGGSKHICPAEISDKLKESIQNMAMDAHRCLGCSGFSRTDIRADKNEIFALETNTIPGMTNKSLVPDAARAVGISFEDLCEMFIEYELN